MLVEEDQVLTEGVSGSRGDEDSVHDTANLLSTQSEQITIFKLLLLPSHRSIVDLSSQRIVQLVCVSIVWRKKDRMRTCSEGLCAASGSEGVASNDEMCVACALQAGEEGSWICVR
jgi:hypothetical protein